MPLILKREIKVFQGTEVHKVKEENLDLQEKRGLQDLPDHQETEATQDHQVIKALLVHQVFQAFR